MHDYARRFVFALNSSKATDETYTSEFCATFSCKEDTKSAFDKFRNTNKAWNIPLDSGRNACSFGVETAALIDSIVQIWENDPDVFQSPCIFDRKQERLKSVLFSDAMLCLQNIYSRHMRIRTKYSVRS